MSAPCCPACPGSGMLLGCLGRLRWFRCRNCGIDFQRRQPPRSQRNRSSASTPERNHE